MPKGKRLLRKTAEKEGAEEEAANVEEEPQVVSNDELEKLKKDMLDLQEGMLKMNKSMEDGYKAKGSGIICEVANYTPTAAGGDALETPTAGQSELVQEGSKDSEEEGDEDSDEEADEDKDEEAIRSKEVSLHHYDRGKEEEESKIHETMIQLYVL
ncbi:unnamed protein product [Arabis nemorensis]|uniref:Uncharacterized protein n=1 Tax=Arabis nemorensis TaxID=586526 RepID=A0A565CPC3_9BRAS|nr:unnamed protein product [Arabis nemorensis]